MLHGINASIGLILLPLIITNYESEQVKNFILSESYTLLLQALWLYGFDLIGVKSIVDDKRVKNTIVEITALRIAIFIVLIILVKLSVSAGLFKFDYIAQWMMYYFMTTLCHSYFYQAYSSNLYLASMSAMTKGFALVYLVYAIVVDSTSIEIHEILDVLIISAFANMVLSNLFIFISLKNTSETLSISIDSIAGKIRTGSTFFFNNLCITLMRGVNVPLLSNFLSNENLGIYALVERYFRILQAFVRPLNDNSMPHVIRDFKENDNLRGSIEKNTKLQKYLNYMLLALIFVLTFAALTSADFPVSNKIIILIAVMCPSIVFSYKNYFYGLIGLELTKRAPLFFKLILFVTILNLVMIMALTHFFGIFGAGMSYALVEGFLLILVFRALRYA